MVLLGAFRRWAQSGSESVGGGLLFKRSFGESSAVTVHPWIAGGSGSSTSMPSYSGSNSLGGSISGPGAGTSIVPGATEKGGGLEIAAGRKK